jgi:hypothetical protein
MNAIEFNVLAKGDVVKIPYQYSGWHNKSLRVILLSESSDNTNNVLSSEEIKAFFASKQLDLQNYKFDREEANAR